MRLLKFFLVVFLFVGINASGQININHYLQQGHSDLMNSNYTSAIHRFNTIIQIKPELLEAYYLRGFAKYSLSDYYGAYADFNKVIALNPYFGEGYRFRGITKAAMQDFQDAMEDFEKAIELDLTSADNYVSRGFTYLMIKDYEKAIKDFNQALFIDKDLPYAYLHRGFAKMSIEDYKGAIQDFSRGIKLNPYNTDGFGRRALAFAALEEYDRALSDLDFAIKMDNTNTLYYFNRALIKYKAKDYDGTMKDYNTVIQLDPENALTYFNRAILKSELGDDQGAIDDFTKSAELNPNNILPYFNRGGIKYDLEDYYGAIDDWSQAIEIFPDFAKAYQARSSARYQIGDIIGANEDKKVAKLKIEEYQANQEGDSTMASFMDTSYNFNKVIEFDSDFYRANVDDGQVQNKKVVIDLKPILLVTSFDERLPVEKLTYYLKSLETLNAKNPLSVKFTVARELAQLTVDSVRNLLNQTEQMKMVSSLDNYLYFYQGLLNSMIQNYNQAIKAYTTAISLDQNFELAYFNRANTRYLMIDYINSLDDFSQIVTIEGKATTKQNDTRIVDQNEAYQDVINDLDKAIEINPKFGFAYYNRANVKCMTKDFTGAIDDYTSSLKTGIEIPQAYFNRGLTLIYLQDKEKGCLDMGKAGELGIEEAYPVIKKYCNKDSD